MSGIFHRRKPSGSSTSEYDLLVASLHHQTNENNDLKNKIEDLKEATDKNKVIFEQFSKENDRTEAQIQELKKYYSDLQGSMKEQEIVLKELRETKFQLITDKDTKGPQQKTAKEMQDLLDLSLHHNEGLIFKDKHDKVWEIVLKNDLFF